jgi:hypothetical protein
MAIDLRKDEECRKSLMKYFKDNEILYGEVSVHITIAVSDFLLEWETKKETENNIKNGA